MENNYEEMVEVLNDILEEPHHYWCDPDFRGPEKCPCTKNQRDARIREVLDD